TALAGLWIPQDMCGPSPRASKKPPKRKGKTAGPPFWQRGILPVRLLLSEQYLRLRPDTNQSSVAAIGPQLHQFRRALNLAGGVSCLNRSPTRFERLAPVANQLVLHRGMER